VIASLQPFHAYDDSEGGHDALHPRALLAAPLSLAGAGAGVVLLTSSVAGREFTDEHEQLVSAVATNAGPTLVDAGAFTMPLVEAPPVEAPAGEAPEIGAPEVAAEEPIPAAFATATRPSRPPVHRVGWAARVRSRMTRIQAQKEAENQRYRADILNAVRNLS